MDSHSFTTAEVAKLCRVSDATVKRWELAGLIKSERTNGGHRRFRAEEVARFQNEKNIGQKQKIGDESTSKAFNKRSISNELSDCVFFHALMKGSEEEASNILIKRTLAGEILCELMDGLITKTMHHIGDLWHEGKITIAQEHLASRTVISSLHNLRSSLPIPETKNKLAICLAFEGDLHELPTRCAQMTLESCGWDVWNFGANTPLYSVSTECDEHTPDLVCISSTFMKDIDRYSRDYKDFREKLAKCDTIIAIGGKSFEDETLSERFPAEHYLKNFSSLAEIASSVR